MIDNIKILVWFILAFIAFILAWWQYKEIKSNTLNKPINHALKMEVQSEFNQIETTGADSLIMMIEIRRHRNIERVNPLIEVINKERDSLVMLKVK